MKISDIDDADKLVTKDYLEVVLGRFENKMMERLNAIVERLARVETRVDGLQWTVRGLYGLLIVAVFVNHFWK
jgi:hypothetical protein